MDNIKEQIIIRNIKSLDGLFFSFLMLEHHYENLYGRCCDISQGSAESVTTALESAWGFVDCVHRIREITQSIPSMNAKKTPESRVFLDKTIITEEYRHYIQHLRTELQKSPPDPHPVWGSLSWVDDNDATVSYTAIFGTNIPGTSYAGCVYDQVEQKWVSRVTLSINDKSLNFDPIFEHCKKYRDFILPKLQNLENGTIEPAKVSLIKTQVLTKS